QWRGPFSFQMILSTRAERLCNKLVTGVSFDHSSYSSAKRCFGSSATTGLRFPDENFRDVRPVKCGESSKAQAATLPSRVSRRSSRRRFLRSGEPDRAGGKLRTDQLSPMSVGVACFGFIDCAKQAWERGMRCRKLFRNLSAEPCGWKARPVAP